MICDLPHVRPAHFIQVEPMTVSETIDGYRYEILLMLLLLALLYGVIISGMVQVWYRDDNYSHGFLVPLISGYFLRERWRDLKNTEVAPTGSGLAVIVSGLLLLVLASLGREFYCSRASLVLVIAGVTLYFFGPEVFKKTRLPVLFLLFMVPLPYIIYDAVAFPLKMFISWFSVGCLKSLGLTVVRDGTIIMFPAITLEVADACSGMRSLVSIVTLSTAYAFFLNISRNKRLLLVASGILLAVATNALRVIGTGFLANYYGAAAAQGFFHEFAGVAVFALAMALLVIIGLLLRGRA